MDSAGWMKFKLAVAQIRFTEIAHTYTYTLYVICKYVRKRSVHVGFFLQILINYYVYV